MAVPNGTCPQWHQFQYDTNSGLLAQMTCTNTGVSVSYAYDVLDRRPIGLTS
jgi:hypothetical protein